MRPVIVRLKEYKNIASNSEKELIEYILINPKEVIKMSIYELAKETFTSTSTVIRLCRKIGFKGFKELKKELIIEVTLRENSIIPKQKEVDREDTSQDIIDKVTYRHIISIEETRSLIDLEVFEKCVKLMWETPILHIFAIGASYLAAKDMQYKMMRIGKSCMAVEDYHLQVLQARNMKPNEVAIIFSYSGETEELIKCAEHVKEAGAKLISITRFGHSSIVNLADYNLYIAANEPLIRSGAMTSRVTQLYMVDILYARYINQSYEEAYRCINDTQLEKKKNKLNVEL